MASARFRDLERRLKKLRRRFLPRTFSPTGDYSERQLDHARAYRLLAHAEIEAYLEDRGQEIANSTLAQFQSNGKPTRVGLNLVSFHLVQDEMNTRRLKELYALKKRYCDEALSVATTAYNRTLANNNGIREPNFLRIVLPLGLNPAMVDSAWLSTLDSFGLHRGEVAHKSIRTHQLIDPQTELKTVDDLLKGLRDLDEALHQLK